MANNGHKATFTTITDDYLREMALIFGGPDHVKAGLQQTLEGYHKQGGALVAQLVSLRDMPEEARTPHNETICGTYALCWQCQVDRTVQNIEEGKKQVEKITDRISSADIFAE